MQYPNIMNRLSDCTERRAQLLRRKPVLTDLVHQLSIRSCALSVKTINVEIAALRKILGQIERLDDRLDWPEGVIVRPWMSAPDSADYDHLNALAFRSYREIMEDGEALLAADIETATRAGHNHGQEELTELLTGKRSDNRSRSDQKAQRLLNERDLTALEMELSVHDPIESLNSLKGHKASLEGTLRLFVNVMWFTGMRPAEVWNCVLMVPRIDLAWTPEMVRLVTTDPARAIYEDMMMQVEHASTHTGDTLGVAARNAMNRSNAPSILMIRSAKTTNQNEELRSEYRFQMLQRIPSRQLNLIALATQCRKLRLDEKRKDSIRASMNKILKSIGRHEQRLEDLNLNLYAFRHSFATRAKLAYPPHEAAALTGHTSRNTLYVYGERNLRSATGKGGKPHFNQDWLPTPDPVFAEMIRRNWHGEARPAPAPRPAA